MGKVTWKGGAGRCFFDKDVHHHWGNPPTCNPTLVGQYTPSFNTHLSPTRKDYGNKHACVFLCRIKLPHPSLWQSGTVSSSFLLDPELLSKPGSFTQHSHFLLQDCEYMDVWLTDCLRWFGNLIPVVLCNREKSKLNKLRHTSLELLYSYTVFCWHSCIPYTTQKSHTSEQDGESHCQWRAILLSCRLKKHLCRYSICCYSLELDGSS